jgi:hypothetical protein
MSSKDLAQEYTRELAMRVGKDLQPEFEKGVHRIAETGLTSGIGYAEEFLKNPLESVGKLTKRLSKSRNRPLADEARRQINEEVQRGGGTVEEAKKKWIEETLDLIEKAGMGEQLLALHKMLKDKIITEAQYEASMQRLIEGAKKKMKGGGFLDPRGHDISIIVNAGMEKELEALMAAPGTSAQYQRSFRNLLERAKKK